MGQGVYEVIVLCEPGRWVTKQWQRCDIGDLLPGGNARAKPPQSPCCRRTAMLGVHVEGVLQKKSAIAEIALFYY